jgi:hypothetical protein
MSSHFNEYFQLLLVINIYFALSTRFILFIIKDISAFFRINKNIC